MQLCIIWAATQEKAVTKLARDVWFAALDVQFWRSKHQPGQSYKPSLKGFQIASDIAKLLEVEERKLRAPLRQLDQVGLLRVTDDGPWFATCLNDISVPDRVRARISTMFEKLHPSTRDKIIAVPRRLLKLIVKCDRKTVRLATLLGLVLRIMLEKRTDQYEGHKGCCKAKWITDVFGVGVDRVKTERRKLIREEWFTEEPTPPRVQKRFGLWLRLNLTPTPSRPKPLDKVSPDADEPAKVEPQNGSKCPKLQPLLNPYLPSKEGRSNNQKLPEKNLPGVENNANPLLSKKPTWKNIIREDLDIPDRRMSLFEDAIASGILRNTEADRLTFFAAMARTLQKATDNAAGFLRQLVERPDYRDFITQSDEDTALQWLGESQLITRPIPIAEPKEVMPSLSKDALTVQILIQDLNRVRYKGHPLALAQRTGHLSNWTEQRWDEAVSELTGDHRRNVILPSSIDEVIDTIDA